MAIHSHCLGCLALAGALAVAGPAEAATQERLAELRTQFTSESDPVRKVKALVKLGDAQFELLRREADSGRYETALRIGEEYRDEVKTALGALKAARRDADKNPAGFKPLEIHLRKSIRRLEHTIQTIPADLRIFFQAVRKELEELDKELIEALFPRQPGKRTEAGKQKG